MNKKISKHATFGRLDHGMRHTLFYEVWKGIKQRCYNKNHMYYKNYGGKGIVMSTEWLTFRNFMDDMLDGYLDHQKKFGIKNTSIDRLDNSKHYCKENCRWTTRQIQMNNTRKNVIVEYLGEKLSIAEWSRKTGIRYLTLYNRIIILKMPIEKALKKTNYNFKQV